jgi:hypothetical protein
MRYKALEQASGGRYTESGWAIYRKWVGDIPRVGGRYTESGGRYTERILSLFPSRREHSYLRISF